MDIFTLLHPKLVHFPVALFISAWVLEMASLAFKDESMHKAAWYVYIMAALSSLFAAASGLWEADRLQIKHPVLYAHRNYGIALVAAAWASLIAIFVLRRQNSYVSRPLFTTACFITAALVIAAGFWGGKLVYEYGIGVSN